MSGPSLEATNIPLTFALFPNSSRKYRTVCGAAASILSNVHKIDKGWTESVSLNEEHIIRIEIDCLADSENGATVSSALLSNMSQNRVIEPTSPRVLYIERSGEAGILGYGCCMKETSLERAMANLPSMSSSTVILGGNSFYSLAHGQRDSLITSASEDCSIPQTSWLIPLVEIRIGSITSGSATINAPLWPHMVLAVNIQVKQLLQINCGETGISVFGQLVNLLTHLSWSFSYNGLGPGSISSKLPPLSGPMRVSGMTKDEYASAVDEALRMMESGQLNKVVYALRRTGTALCAIDAAALLLAVATCNSADEGRRFTFLFAPNGLQEPVFVSLTPERLCRVEGNALYTEALAGTYPREFIENGGIPDDDKTSHEHGAVTKYILDCLASLGGTVEVASRELVILKDLAHFRQTIVATAKAVANEDNPYPLSGAYLLLWATRNLHPTSAVCGMPVDVATHQLQRHEKFDRGLFASCCGAISSTGGELFVGIRSAVVHRSTVHVYAGAGLVPGSTVESEWKEMELKMSQFTRVLSAMMRPAMEGYFVNATAAMSAIFVEELLRQGVSAFCVCPGSRSTPLAVAIYRNSVSRGMTQVVHDERAAGFYAVGCARAGVLCAVLVTSGTAVSNLLPAVCEAREAGLPFVLLTADRPAESRDVGEAQTIRQVGMFRDQVGWERNFQPLSSEAPKSSAAIIMSILADIAFGVGEIARIRNRVVHFNIQIRKPEIDPVIVEDSFPKKFTESLHPKVTRWLASTSPFTVHSSLNGHRDTFDFFRVAYDSVVTRLRRWVAGEYRYWSVIVVAGELRSVLDAQELRAFCEAFQIPCICDTTSMLMCSAEDARDDNCIFLGADRLFNSSPLLEALSASARIIIRVGGSMISARVHEWLSNCPLATVVRVRDDGSMDSRHDASWVTDYYVHASVGAFAAKLSEDLSCHRKGSVEDTTSICPVLQVLRIAHQAHLDCLQAILADPAFTEPQVALILHQESDGDAPVFLSSSMACRDYDGLSCFPMSENAEIRQTFAKNGVRRTGCNRGANGIDGVVSTAVGYAYGCASKTKPVTVLIGDVAMLHDATGIAIAAGTSPGNVGALSVLGSGRIGKIVCINNSGGAIFSFLPAAQFRGANDFFSPYLETPHELHISQIAAALSPSTSQGDRKSVRVTCVAELRAALRDDQVFFVECVCLPSLQDNFAIHKRNSQLLVETINLRLVGHVFQGLQWTHHRLPRDHFPTNSDDPGSSRPDLTVSSTPNTDTLLVMLHGWMGVEDDWSPFLTPLMNRCNANALTVSSGGDILCPTVFCFALRKVIQQVSLSYGSSKKIVLVGYSQGGRLAMHYRSLFSDDVHALIVLSTAPGKAQSVDIEHTVMGHWSRTCPDTQTFLKWWYDLPVFSKMSQRAPEAMVALIQRREGARLCVDNAIRNMVCTVATKSASGSSTSPFIELAVVGSCDAKYVGLANQTAASGTIGKVVSLPGCGHALLAEAAKGPNFDTLLEALMNAVESLPSAPVSPAHCGAEPTLEFRLAQIDVKSFSIPLKTPLSVLSSGKLKIFESRRGVRIFVKLHAKFTNRSDEAPASVGDLPSITAVGVGEAYEPVFSLANTDLSYSEVELQAAHAAALLQTLTGTITLGPSSASSIADATRSLLSAVQDALSTPDRASSVILYGYELAIVHALSRLSRFPLADAIGAYIDRTASRQSHVRINDFATIRASTTGVHSVPIIQTGTPTRSQVPRTVLKMKVGDETGNNACLDAQRVNDYVSTCARSDVGWLRLDANQSWSVKQAKAFAEALSQDSLQAIAYVEEPLKPDWNEANRAELPARLQAMYRELLSSDEKANNPWLRIPIALDETLCAISAENASKLLSVIASVNGSSESTLPMNKKRIVFKPSLLSLDHSLLRDPLCDVTISCTFESGVGLAFQVCLASLFGEDSVHGVHANPDMAAAEPENGENLEDGRTGRFQRLIKVLNEDGGSKVVLVSDAEQLLNECADHHTFS